MARQRRPRGESPDAIDGYGVERLDLALVVQGERLDERKVGMLAGSDVTATRAGAAREPVRSRRFAQQRSREVKRERALADAALAREKQGVRPCLPPRERLDRRLDLPGQELGPRPSRRGIVFDRGYHVAINRESCARTSSNERDESITRNRAGNAAARSR